VVIVDSDIWSAALRRRKAERSTHTAKLAELIESDEVIIIGLVRQEVLSGIREAAHFEKVRRRLRAFPDQPLTSDIHELAASFFNTCRTQGIQGSHTDFLICACSVAWRAKIFAKDGDYAHFEAYLPIDILRL